MRIYRSLGELQRYVDNGGMMRRTFYVDVENGDDNNDGSESAPFKTIKKACDSVPVGGCNKILLAANQDFFIDEDITITNKTVFIHGDSTNHPILHFASYDNGSYNYSRRFILRNSFLRFLYCDLQNESKSNESLSWNIDRGVGAPFETASYATFGSVAFYRCTINQTRDYFASAYTGLGVFQIYNTTINFSGDATALILGLSGTISLGIGSCNITSGYKWIANGTIGQNVITNLSSLDT